VPRSPSSASLEKWGETVKALVVLAEGARADEAELIAHCKQRLAGYKAPTSVELREAIPRTATGKVQKFKLREQYWAGGTGRSTSGVPPAASGQRGGMTADEKHVSGGDPERMDAAPGSGGMPAAGADGETGAREQLRQDLGERGPGAGTEQGGDLEQTAALGATDDPQGGSLQPGGQG
jgi:hypothetical protein